MAGKAFIKLGQSGIGTQTTTERDAGIGTAVGTMTFNVTTGALEVYTTNNAWDAVSSSFDTTGGVKDTTSRSGYNIHTFTSDGNFTWSGGPISDCEYVCIGGGGAGGDYAGPYPGYNSGAGGGGAGGMRSGTFPLPGSGTNIPITVGSGGASSVSQSGSYIPQPSASKAQSGSPSVIPSDLVSGSINSYGGGCGSTGNAGPGPQTPYTRAGQNGGSGGGGARDVHQTAGEGNKVTETTTPAPTQGNDGGGYDSPDGHGGGGGGAGGAGSGAGSHGHGGNGSSSSITGSSKTHAGGGGGGRGANPSTPGEGKAGGGDGGSDANEGSNASISSSAGYGSGGGGAGRGGNDPITSRKGGNANDGIVIIAVPSPS